MAYLLRLSKVQWGWLVGISVIAAAIVAVGWALEPTGDQTASTFTTAMSIRDIAPKLGVTGKALKQIKGKHPVLQLFIFGADLIGAAGSHDNRPPAGSNSI